MGAVRAIPAGYCLVWSSYVETGDVTCRQTTAVREGIGVFLRSLVPAVALRRGLAMTPGVRLWDVLKGYFGVFLSVAGNWTGC
ncbi:hypothetical protein RKD18_001232 [Streptomyces phaeoluteigriseus]